MNISDYINKRNLNKNLSDEKFYAILDDLVDQMIDYDFIDIFSAGELYADYENLKRSKNEKQLTSRDQHGLKIVKHFNPHIYDVENKNGKSFSKLWKDKSIMRKVLIRNRKGHCTPYLSHIKHCVYFVGAIPRTNIFRPQLTMSIVKNKKIVFDPCAGWGSRMIGSVAQGSEYIGFEPCEKTYNALVSIVRFLEIEDRVRIINDSVLNYELYDLPEYDVVITSPPFYDMEIYDKSELQSVNSSITSYSQWISEFLSPTIKFSLSKLKGEGTSNWNAVNFGKCKLVDDIRKVHENYGYDLHKDYFITVPTRPSTKASRTSKDVVKSYKKIIERVKQAKQ